MTPVWLKLDGRHEPPLRWQASQLWAPTGTCSAGLPVAFALLWQVAQLPGATLVWLNVAGFHAVVR